MIELTLEKFMLLCVASGAGVLLLIYFIIIHHLNQELIKRLFSVLEERMEIINDWEELAETALSKIDLNDARLQDVEINKCG